MSPLSKFRLGVGVAIAVASSLGAAVPMAMHVSAGSGRGAGQSSPAPKPTRGPLSPGPTITASVFQTNPGPLQACSTPPCPANTETAQYIFVQNGNPIVYASGGTARNLVPGAYAVTSIDESITVNGVPQGTAGTWSPPPAGQAPFSGSWPSTVTCPAGPPCNVPTSPAAMPGENVAIFHIAWTHGTGELDGTYIFTFVLHGSVVGGSALDVTVSGRAIDMTR